MSVKLVRGLLLAMVITSSSVSAQNVIEDGGVGLTRQEVEYIVKYWTPQMQTAAAIDQGDRIELLNMALATKRIAMQADMIDPAVDPEEYWQLQFAIRNRQRDFVQRYYLKTLEIPDMGPLAEEQYRTQKDKYAFVPERRMSSHILIKCLPTECKRNEKRPIADEVVAKLQAGADFEELVTEYSDDRGTRKKGGKFDKWVKMGEPHVSPPYVGALFDIDTVGGYSGAVGSEFGYHIIRLDGIQESYYLPLEEVKPKIIATLEREYKELAVKEFNARFRLSDEARMDYEALDEIFLEYQPVNPVVVPAPESMEEPEPEAAQAAAADPVVEAAEQVVEVQEAAPAGE